LGGSGRATCLVISFWVQQIIFDIINSPRVNFIIYSSRTKEPTIVENGFSRNILMCYYGNHYDSVFPRKFLEEEKFIQGIIYSLLDKVEGKKFKSNYEYRNVGWSCWVNDLLDQQKNDEIIAHQLSDQSNSFNYQNLTGYYKREEENQWKVKSNKKKQSPKERQQIKLLSEFNKDEEKILLQIRQNEIKKLEFLEISQKEQFPSLGLKTSKIHEDAQSKIKNITETDIPPEVSKINQWAQNKDWKNFVTQDKEKKENPEIIVISATNEKETGEEKSKNIDTEEAVIELKRIEVKEDTIIRPVASQNLQSAQFHDCSYVSPFILRSMPMSPYLKQQKSTSRTKAKLS